MFQKIKNNLGLIVLAALALAAVFVSLAVWERTPSGKIKIDFFDVGQGSAVFVAADNGNQVLIDGGPSDAILAKLGEVMPVFDRKIELLVLTHPDADHLDGLIAVLKRYEVGEIIETGIKNDTADFRAWEYLIKEKNIPVVLARAGETAGLADNLLLKIIYPLGEIAGGEFKNTNNTSVVAKLFYGQNVFLLTGDAEEAAEQALILGGENLRADILLVGHHGSKNSTGADFLAAVAPKQAIIQVGAKNRYGHPTPEVLDRLAKAGAEIFRTDKMGDIGFACDLEKCVRK